MKSLRVLVLVLCSFLITGCWGITEIEQRGFILSLGIDKVTNGDGNDKNKWEISIVNPDTAESEEGKVLKSTVLSTEGSSFNIGIMNLMEKYSKVLNYEHTQVFLIGQSLLEDDEMVKSILDTLTRDRQFHTSMLIYMIPKPYKVADVLNTDPKTKELTTFYIKGIADHELQSARIGKILFHDFIKLISSTDGDAVIPIIMPEDDDELKVSGMGILKDYKFIGELDPDETIAYRWCDNRVKGGVIEVAGPGYNPTFIYRNFGRKIKLEKIKDDTVYLKYKMKAEGAIEEYTLDGRLIDDGVLKKLEKEMEKYMEAQCLEMIKKMQEEYKVDLIGVRDYLKKYHPALYERIAVDFDNFFQNRLVIDVDISIKVRRIGKIL